MIEGSIGARQQSMPVGTIRRKPLRTQQADTNQVNHNHIYQAIPKSSAVDDSGVSIISEGDRVSQSSQPLQSPRFNGLSMEQQQKDKNATANTFEIDPLIISPSQTDTTPGATVSGLHFPHHASSGEPTQLTALRRTRQPRSCSTVFESVLELIFIIAPILFIVFGCFVYIRREQPVDQHGNAHLLAAARYGPTIFPIIFAAIVAKFLRAIAALKLEHGARVLTLEYLLHSRTVFGAVSTIFDLRKFHILTPLLILLWALSPLGGQASLRVIEIGPLYNITTHNFTYLAFVSPLTNEGVGSASANLLAPINAAFTTFLTGSTASKASPQDIFGNIKIPILDALPGSSENSSNWINVPDTEDVVWSSLTGIPVYQPPPSGVSRFTMNTGYMTTDCVVSGQARAESQDYMQSISNLTGPNGGWSGANFAIDVSAMYAFSPTYFVFYSLALQESTDPNPPKPLTLANCSVSMNYVEAQISCNQTTCRTTAVRPSINPASHPANNITNPSLNSSQLTPLNSLGQVDNDFTHFWKNFINATNPSASCDTSFCATSGIEGYLANPDNPFNFTDNPIIWTIGNELVSQRFSQLVNTYWIDSIGPFIISSSGNFNLTKDTTLLQSFNTDSSIGSIQTEIDVIKCSKPWLVILLLSSLILLLSAIGTAIINNFRMGPDILDRFSSLLRDNRYVFDPHYASMEDAFDQSRRLGYSKVRLGDVHPDGEVGHVAIALMDWKVPVQKLDPTRVYA